jgi:hypothetical protein
MFQLLARRTNITEEIIKGLRNWLTDCIGDNALNEAQRVRHAALGAQGSVMSPLVQRQKTANNPTPCKRQNRRRGFVTGVALLEQELPDVRSGDLLEHLGAECGEDLIVERAADGFGILR